MRRLIVGCGDVGRRVARIWQAAGDCVTALTRSTTNADELRRLGIEPVIGDVVQPESLKLLPEADTALYAVGFDRQAGAAKSNVFLNGVTNVLRETAGRIGQFVYVSSTSVYGQDQGEWVDESSPCEPNGEDGRISLAAERAVREFFPPAVVLRLSGIYGPGRLLRRIDAVERGEPIRANPEGFLNLIHVVDAARVAALAAERVPAGTTYLVTDDRPIRRHEYYGELSRLLSAPEPIFECTEQEAARFNKRCSNARVRREFGDVFEFPTIAEGLPNALLG